MRVAPPYVECGFHGCRAPLVGWVSFHTTSHGKMTNLTGKCSNGHAVGRSASNEMTSYLTSIGWQRPKPGANNTFRIPDIEPIKERYMQVSVPEGTKWVLVDMDTGDATPLPGAQITRRLSEGNQELVEINILLGEPVKRKKVSEKVKRAKEEAESADDAGVENPFTYGTKAYKIAQTLIEKGRIKYSVVHEQFDKEGWDAKKYASHFAKRMGVNIGTKKNSEGERYLVLEQ